VSHGSSGLDRHPGLGVPYSRRDGLVPRVLVQPLQRFAATEISSGLLLALAAVVALVLANSDAYEWYHHLLETHLSIGVGDWVLDLSLHHWINDLLMAVFFFVVGLEIKRELVHGQLRDRKAAALPVIAALGGMVVPAALYAAVNAGGPGAGGWGIPMATDIAFAVGALALVGRRLPASLKVFLLTLAVADDLGAIAVIAIFYSQGTEFQWLLAMVGISLLIVLLRRLEVRWLAPYLVLAGTLWLATLYSGVHATIAGVILGFLTPANPFHAPRRAADVLHRRLDELKAVREPEPDVDEYEMLEVTRLSRESVSPLARLETGLHPWSAFLILPIFAFANAGVRVVGTPIGEVLTQPVTLGVIIGLVVGKPLGITLFAWIATRLKVGALPPGVAWSHIVGVGLLAGIGFTVALFVAQLSFTDPDLTDGSKIGILLASLLAAVVGGVLLSVIGGRKPVAEETSAEPVGAHSA
jgi:NhaA family Na+:H+ antiporter